MKKLDILTLALVISCMTGCAKVKKDWVADGGSKADAVVELAVFYDDMERPIVSDEQAMEVALKRCKAWGYASAEPFGTHQTSLNYFDGFFYHYKLTKKFQCLDAVPEDTPK